MLLSRASLALCLRAVLGGPLEITILHVNDHHSHLEHSDFDLDVSGVGLGSPPASGEVEVPYGGFPALAALVERLAGSSTNPLKVHAGDAITGTPYYSTFKGEADAAMMDAICFDAFALGNHEFDDGDAVLADFIGMLHGGAACNSTPVLSANLSPGASSPLLGKVDRFAVKPFGNETVAMVGITVAKKTMRSSSPSPGTVLEDEFTAAQQAIDELTAQGHDKIVLLTHIGYHSDLALAGRLRGVDVIVGGDSHTLMGSSDGMGLVKAPQVSEYPKMTTDADGNKVCVVQAWDYGHLIGQLSVRFDADGLVESCTGSPKVPFERPAGLSEEDAQILDAHLTGTGSFSGVSAEDMAAVQSILNGFKSRVDELKQAVVGQSNATLCLEHLPGTGRSDECGVAATWEHGSQVGQVVAKAFLEVTPTSQIALQNAGGVRADLEQGNITLDDVYTILPFSNTLVELELTGAHIKTVLEDALGCALDPEAPSTGTYPIAAGLRFDIDASAPVGGRVSNLQVNPRLSGSWAPLSPADNYTVVANSYIARGQDCYTTFGALPRQDTFTQYAQGLVKYVEQVSTLTLPADDEFSTQVFVDADGCDHSTTAAGSCTATAAVAVSGASLASVRSPAAALALLALCCAQRLR